MTLPNFFVVGAGKAGTTSLHQYLAQHPEVYMSPTKEPNFFAFEGEKLDFRGPEAHERINRWSVTTLGDYEALFDGVSGEKAIGESSPTYLYVPEAAGRIKRRVPEARVIAVLRDPVKRAYSAYLHTVRSGREKLGFAEALEREEERIRAKWEWIWHYKSVGLYHGQLSRYFDLFGREKVRVYLYEDLSKDPVAVAQDIFRFLGVDDAFEPDTSLRHNTSGLPRSRALLRFVKRPNAVKALLRPLLPEKTRKRLSVNVQNWNLEKAPPMSEETRMELVEAYREDAKKLEDLIGRDLSGWLGKKEAQGA